MSSSLSNAYDPHPTPPTPRVPRSEGEPGPREFKTGVPRNPVIGRLTSRVCQEVPLTQLFTFIGNFLWGTG